MSRASITVLPVTRIRSSGIRSASSACRAVSVGAKCRSTSGLTRRRLASSGNGEREVAGAQARLDVADRNAAVEAGQRRAQHGRRVALHEHHVGRQLGEGPVGPLDQPGGEPGERLVRLHRLQVGVDGDAEQVDHLLDHLAVLAGVDDHAAAARRRRAARPRPGPS